MFSRANKMAAPGWSVCAAVIWLVQHCRQLYAPSQHDLLACIVVKHAGYQAEAQFARFFHFGTVSYLFWIAHGSARRSEMARGTGRGRCFE